MITRTENFDLSGLNTFRMKVSCRCYVEYDSARDLETLDFDLLPQPIFHMGGGSNLLFTKNFEGTILHSKVNFIKFVDMGFDSVPMAVGAGALFDDFCQKACSAGLWGAENLSMIPGEVGAAAVQNIGAYGVEARDIISGVVCYDIKDRAKRAFKKEECCYGYRDSLFKKPENKGRYIITSVLFRLERSYSPHLDYGNLKLAFGGIPPHTPNEVREAICRIRAAKLPAVSEKGSAGSFFKNPIVTAEQFRNIVQRAHRDNGEDYQVPHFSLPDGTIKVPAAWMIEQCSLKGTQIGGAAVWEKQPLVIVNESGEASPQDILELEDKIITMVETKYAIRLFPEVEHI